MKEKTSIILLTCNRKDFSKKTIDGFYERLIHPDFIHLIVIDNNSKDGTTKMLTEYEQSGKIHKLILLGDGETVNISNAYNLGFKYVESEYFVTAQDDVVISKLEPDLVEQLIALLEKYPDAAMMATRIQRIPNLLFNEGNEDYIPARRALSAYFRIQKKSEFEKMGDNPFSTKDWDDVGTLTNVREKLGKDGYWARDLWCNHLGYTTDNRGYPDGYKRMWGLTDRPSDNKRKPYPKIDDMTCKPLPGEKIFR